MIPGQVVFLEIGKLQIVRQPKTEDPYERMKYAPNENPIASSSVGH
jgi:hypothetical protein